MPVYKDKNDTWTARLNYVDSDGRKRSKKKRGFLTKGEASKAYAEMQIEHQKVSSRITFDDIFREYIEEQKGKVKPTTHMHYQPLYDHIKDDLGKVEIEKLTIPRYKAFKKYLDGKDMSTSRKNRCHRFVKTLVRLAYENHGIINNVPDRVGGFTDPVNVLPEEEEIKIITKDQFDSFLEKISDQEYKTLFMVLFYQGTRLGEALALTWNDIDFDGGIMKINKTYTSKLNKDYQTSQFYITKPKTRASIRNIPIEKSTLESLKMLHSDYMEFEEFSEEWFVFGGIRPLSETTVTVRKDEAIAAAGLPRITLHQFRHSCASYLFEKGAKPTAVQKYLGHSKLSTTMNIYTHLYPEDLMNIHN
ncbi:MAG: site-specific integrase [Erysipelotrichaceae bacterium]|nr:site-specific integrase [Erysipelotrichaceae bacterium]